MESLAQPPVIFFSSHQALIHKALIHQELLHQALIDQAIIDQADTVLAVNEQ